MTFRSVFFTLLTIPLSSGQNQFAPLTYGGSQNDSIHGVTVDSSGNIYVVGTTYSADLPLKNAFQPLNSGTQVILSADAGATWKPLQSPLAPQPYSTFQVAVDPTNFATIYATSGSILCKSVDAGQHFQCANLPFIESPFNVNSIAIDPQTPSTLYLSANAPGGIFKSIDGGQTWNSDSQGLSDNGFSYIITIDPFHSNVVFAWAGYAGYVSRDGAATWTPSSLPYPAAVNNSESFVGFFFDAVTPGVVYGPGFNGSSLTIQKSTDDGQTWVSLNVPFSGLAFIGPDPKTTGTLYALGMQTGSTGFHSLWKSADGGATWTSTPVPAGLIGPFVFDPQNPQIILAGSYSPYPSAQPATYRSADGGKTWSQVAPRILQPAFSVSAPGIVYAIAAPTSDAFLAKFLPDGQTLVFATYLGGAANDTGNAIALDATGNIWIAGATSSLDFPVTPGAFQPTLKGPLNGFIAKFTNDGQLVASSYLGGSSQDSIIGLAVGPRGNPWVTGAWSSEDFPFTSVPPSVIDALAGYFVELDSTAGQVLVAMPVDGQFDMNGNGIAVDSSGNVTLTGNTTDPEFPVTVQPLTGGVPPQAKAFVMKLDPSGATIYSTYFGGTRPAPIVGTGIGIPSEGNEEDYGVAVAVDSAGNAYIAGYTSATDFPTTPGAYQTALADACPYPAFSNNTGLIGVISTFYMDDSFVVKLSPDGKTAVYSTLIGGQCYDHPLAIAVDASGRAAITGETDSFDYPQVSAVEGAPVYGDFASFLSVLNPSGSALELSTYLYAGATPSVAAAPNGSPQSSYVVAGRTGPGAQSVPYSGAYTLPTSAATKGYLAIFAQSQNAPAENLTQVRNGFNHLPGPVAPGEIVELSVPGFSPAQPADIGLNLLAPLTTSLAGVQVSFDGRAAFLISVFPGRIVCIAPVEIAGQSSTAIQVTVNGAASNVLNVSVAATAVGLLSLDGSGTGAADARNADGSLNSAANPAAIGSQVTIYFTGGGVTSPPEADGAAPASLAIAPAASLPLYPLGGVIRALPGFVPGIFSYTFTVPAPPSPASTLQVSMQTDFVQSQFLEVYIH